MVYGLWFMVYKNELNKRKIYIAFSNKSTIKKLNCNLKQKINILTFINFDKINLHILNLIRNHVTVMTAVTVIIISLITNTKYSNNTNSDY